MARERKTIDTFEIHVNYGQGFEHETTEFSQILADEQRKTYRTNCPRYPVKIVRKREPKANYTADQLKKIAAEIEQGLRRWMERRRKAKEARTATAKG